MKGGTSSAMDPTSSGASLPTVVNVSLNLSFRSLGLVRTFLFSLSVCTSGWGGGWMGWVYSTEVTIMTY